MKKIIAAGFIMSAIAFLASYAYAQMPALSQVQGMMGRSSVSAADWEEIVEHTTREEKEGRELWEKLQAKETECSGLSDHDFATLGEYFMGAMTGGSHPAMNAMMIQVHGEEGEEQIHTVMGKRLSGCDASAALPSGAGGWMPMMNMMTGAWSSPFGFNSTQTMMNFGTFGAFGLFGLLFMILWWALIIAALVAVIKWLARQFRGSDSVGGSMGLTAGKSALDILKERYARGEIDKKEFEEKKRDLGM